MSQDFVDMLSSLSPTSSSARVVVSGAAGGRVSALCGRAEFLFKKDAHDDCWVWEEGKGGGTSIFARSSNKEWAASFRAARTQSGYSIAPEHAGGTAFQLSAPVWTVDGTVVNPTATPSGGELSGTLLQLGQDLVARGGGLTGDVFRVKSLHSLDARGVMAFRGSLEVLQDGVELGFCYGPMLPIASAALLTDFVGDDGSRRRALANGSSATIAAGPESFCVTGPANPDVAVAMAIDFPARSLRRGLPGAPESFAYHLWSRADPAKLYAWAYKNYVASAGEKWEWGGRWVSARVPGIHRLLGGGA